MAGPQEKDSQPLEAEPRAGSAQPLVRRLLSLGPLGRRRYTVVAGEPAAPGLDPPAIFSFFIFIAGGLKVGPVRRQLLAYQEPSRKKETDVGLLDQRSEEEPGHRPEHQIVKEKRKGAQGLTVRPLGSS